MKVVTPDHEKAFVAAAIAEPLARLQREPELLDAFIAYAVKTGADRLVFPERLNRVIKGQFPSAFMVGVLLQFFSSDPRARAKKKPRQS